mmetsp:Transcript_26066/g.62793  ORF Transcript_26066/g.62793 Transcript_26066/m.62793 type:complete len:101 (-) Transcript_26066:160-462(-)
MKKIKKLVLTEKLIKLLIKQSREQNLLCCGINESIKSILDKKAQLCILAANCELKTLKITVRTLCMLNKIHILVISDKKKLGRLCRVKTFVIACQKKKCS